MGKGVGYANLYHVSLTGIKNTYQMAMIYLTPQFRMGNGFAIYSFLLSQGLKIITDADHTAASAKLWTKLADHFEVWLFDNRPLRRLRGQDLEAHYGTPCKFIVRSKPLTNG